jgi:alginate O-acetyltransferase complex protein AlgI
MLFSTPLFLFLFLPVVLSLYFVVRAELKNLTLFVCSLVFFLWGEPVFTWIILASSIIDWSLCHFINKEKINCKIRLILAFIAIASNIGILIYYKYANFIINNLNMLIHSLGFNEIATLNIMLPLGVSFLVFEKITYIVDIYKRIGNHSKSILNYLTYVFLFPKLLAGPIVKYHEIEGQLEEHKTSFDRVSNGMFRFILGLGKKVFIADTMAEFVDVIFAMPAETIGAGNAWLVAICFTMQIYFDFSGYSDMAIGIAQIFGFSLRENFNMPYLSQNFTEFWKKWHISLSTWIKEYVYIPFGGNRVSNAMIYRNLLIAFMLSGIWHGANWTFLVWGLYHGFFLIMDRIFWRNFQKRFPQIINVAINFFFIVIGWVIFRSPDIHYALVLIKNMFLGFMVEGSFVYITNNIYFFLVTGICITFLPLIPKFEYLKSIYIKTSKKCFIECGLIFILAILAFAKVSTTTFNPFLYFRF